MPELTLSRFRPTPLPMLCMYCGAPATKKQEWREEHRKPNAGGGEGTDIVPVPGGDDPVSAIVGILLLPLALWELFKGLVAAVGWLARKSPPPSSPPPVVNPPTTLVAVTTCDRHSRFRDRFVWVGAALVLGLILLWVWAIVVTARSMGTEEVGLATTLILAAILSTVLVPVGLGFWYSFGGPVIVDRVNENEVILDRVRQAYLDAAGLSDRTGEGVSRPSSSRRT